MLEINIQSILEMLAQSVGIEGAEKVLNEAIQESNLNRKAFYSEDEFKHICENMKKRGGFIKIFATLAQSSEYRESEYQKIIDKGKKEKEYLTNINLEMEALNNELKISNEKLKIANENLNRMQEDLIRSEKMAAIGYFASAIGHELRNPLGSIKNICFYLKKSIKTTDPRINELLDILYKEVDLANKIVTDLLDYSSAKKLNRVSISLTEIIDDAIKSYPKNEKIKIEKDFSNEIKEIFIDPDKMKQVFVKIISNAYHSMPEGGTLSISIKKDEDQLLSQQSSEFIRICFKDTGFGMNKETTKYIFDPLFTTKLKGIGLGLPIAKEIISNHGGNIIVKSEEGKGTTVNILLPLEGINQ